MGAKGQDWDAYRAKTLANLIATILKGCRELLPEGRTLGKLKSPATIRGLHPGRYWQPCAQRVVDQDGQHVIVRSQPGGVPAGDFIIPVVIRDEDQSATTGKAGGLR
jgi:hypothetical protein